MIINDWKNDWEHLIQFIIHKMRTHHFLFDNEPYTNVHIV